MTQKKDKQTLPFRCFISEVNVLRKLFEKKQKKKKKKKNNNKKKPKKKKKKQQKTTGNYIQQPIDIGVCGVNLKLPTSRILAELFFIVLKVYQKP